MTQQQLDHELFEAVREGRVEAIAGLVAAGADLHAVPGSMPVLHLAVEFEQLACIRELIRLGVDVHLVNHVSHGWTPLHHAVDVVGDGAWQMQCEPDVRVMELLLELGADPHRPDACGITPWEMGKRCEQPKILETFQRFAARQQAVR